MIEAVVFDLDGVLLDTEELWDEARRQLAEERGARWPDDAQRTTMGMSSPESARQIYPSQEALNGLRESVRGVTPEG